MTASVEVARQAEAPDAVISRGPGEPRPARRQRAAILIVGRAGCRGRSCGRGHRDSGLARRLPVPGGARDLRILHRTLAGAEMRLVPTTDTVPASVNRYLLPHER